MTLVAGRKGGQEALGSETAVDITVWHAEFDGVSRDTRDVQGTQERHQRKGH
jgi:hypothetical protein